jgi:hypothetical protein
VITRFDYLDEQWLVREACIYPTHTSAFRLGTEPDGTVLIEELTVSSLANLIGGVITTLPNILNPDAPPALKHGSIENAFTNMELKTKNRTRF